MTQHEHSSSRPRRIVAIIALIAASLLAVYGCFKVFIGFDFPHGVRAASDDSPSPSNELAALRRLCNVPDWVVDATWFTVEHPGGMDWTLVATLRGDAGSTHTYGPITSQDACDASMDTIVRAAHGGIQTEIKSVIDQIRTSRHRSDPAPFFHKGLLRGCVWVIDDRTVVLALHTS